jgi:hypothetical protein
MAENVFNNPNSNSLNKLNFNVIKSKKPQLGFTVARAEPQFPEEHEPFNVVFNLENIGDVDAKEFAIRMITEFLDDKSLGVDHEDQIVSSLKPGETEEIILEFEYGMHAGSYVIDAYLDYYNQIHKQNEYMGYRHASYDLKVG